MCAEAAGKGGKRAPEMPDPNAKQRMRKMFANVAAKPRHVAKAAATDETSDALLGDILGSIGAGDSARSAHSCSYGTGLRPPCLQKPSPLTSMLDLEAQTIAWSAGHRRPASTMQAAVPSTSCGGAGCIGRRSCAAPDGVGRAEPPASRRRADRRAQAAVTAGHLATATTCCCARHERCRVRCASTLAESRPSPARIDRSSRA